MDRWRSQQRQLGVEYEAVVGQVLRVIAVLIHAGGAGVQPKALKHAIGRIEVDGEVQLIPDALLVGELTR